MESPKDDGVVRLGVESRTEPVDSGEPELGLEKLKQADKETPTTGTPISGLPLHLDPAESREKDKSQEEKAAKSGSPVGLQPPETGIPSPGVPAPPEQPPAQAKDPEPPRAGPVGPISALPKKGEKQSSGADFDLGLGKGRQKQNYSGAVQPVEDSKKAELGDSTRDSFLNPGTQKMSSGGLKENSQTIGIGFGKVGSSEPSSHSEIFLGVEPPTQGGTPPQSTKPQPVAETPAPIQPAPPQPTSPTGNPPGEIGKSVAEHRLHVEPPKVDSDMKLGVEPKPKPLDSGEPELGLEKPKKLKQADKETPTTGTPISGLPLHLDPAESREKDKSQEEKAAKSGSPVGLQPPETGIPSPGVPAPPEQPPAQAKDPEPPRAGPVGPISALPKKGEKQSSGADFDLGLGKGRQKQNYSGAVQPVEDSKKAELGDSTRDSFLNPGTQKMSSGGLKENSQTIGIGFGKVGSSEPSSHSEIFLGVEPPTQGGTPPQSTKPQPVAETPAPIQPAPPQPTSPTGNPPGEIGKSVAEHRLHVEPPKVDSDMKLGVEPKPEPSESRSVSSIENNSGSRNHNYQPTAPQASTGEEAESPQPDGPVRQNVSPGGERQPNVQPPASARGATPNPPEETEESASQKRGSIVGPVEKTRSSQTPTRQIDSLQREQVRVEVEPEATVSNTSVMSAAAHLPAQGKPDRGERHQTVEEALAAIPTELPVAQNPKTSPKSAGLEPHNTEQAPIAGPSRSARKSSVNFSSQPERRKGPRFVNQSSHRPTSGPSQEDSYWSAQGSATPQLGPKPFEAEPEKSSSARSIEATSQEESEDGVILFQKRSTPRDKLQAERTLFQKTGESAAPERSFELMSDDWRRLDHEQKRVKKTLLELKNKDIDIGRVDMTDDSTRVYAQLLSDQKTDPISVHQLAVAFKERTGRQLIIRAPEAPPRVEPAEEVGAVKKSVPQTLRKAQDKTVSPDDYEDLKTKKKEEDEEEFEAYKKVVKKKTEHEQKLYIRASSEEGSSWLAQSKTKQVEAAPAQQEDDSSLKKIRGRGKAVRGSGSRVVSDTGGGGGGGRLYGSQKPRKSKETEETKEKKELKEGELVAVLQENLETDTGLKIKIVRVGLQEADDQERQQGGGHQENGTCATCGTELPPAQAQNCPVCAQSSQEIVALTKTNYRFAGAKMFATADSVVASEQAKQLFTTEKLGHVASLRYWPKIPGHKEILQLRRVTDEAS